MKVRLTKKRMAALHTALSIDDILYEKFRRLNEELDRKYEKLFKAERIIHVLEKRGDGFLYAVKIIDVRTSPDGTEVIVAP